MAKGFGVICKAKRMLKKETLITLYYSFVYPYLQYGIIAWGNTYTNVIDPIIKLQKKVVRVISSSDWNAPSDPIFKSLNLLPAHKVYILNVLLLMYKVTFCLVPNIFSNIFIRNYDVHNYFTRQSDYYHVSAWRLEMVRRSIRIQGVHYWNLIQEKIDCYTSFVTFKYRVKKYLLANELD